MQDSFRKSKLDALQLRASDNHDMVGKQYMHTKNQRIYIVLEFIWNGVTDEWDVLHCRHGTDTKFTRSLSNFNGEFEDGTRRFILIKED